MRGRAAGRGARMLGEGGAFGAMTAVMGIMLFLTVLAGALGLATAAAARGMARDLAGRLTVQASGDAAAGRVLAALRALPGTAASPVARDDLARLLAPWLGGAASDRDLPLPALIDVTLAAGADAGRVAAAARRADPAALVEPHAAWLAPVAALLDAVTWLAAMLVAMLAAAAAAVVVLAARAGLDRHRPTIEVMHLMGATDGQIARLFQRRLALDAALGGGVGAAAALALARALGGRFAGLGSQLVAGAALTPADWLALAALPLAFAALATVAARLAALRALRRML